MLLKERGFMKGLSECYRGRQECMSHGGSRSFMSLRPINSVQISRFEDDGWDALSKEDFNMDGRRPDASLMLQLKAAVELVMVLVAVMFHCEVTNASGSDTTAKT